MSLGIRESKNSHGWTTQGILPQNTQPFKESSQSLYGLHSACEYPWEALEPHRFLGKHRAANGSLRPSYKLKSFHRLPGTSQTLPRRVWRAPFPGVHHGLHSILNSTIGSILSSSFSSSLNWLQTVLKSWNPNSEAKIESEIEPSSFNTNREVKLKHKSNAKLNWQNGKLKIEQTETWEILKVENWKLKVEKY